jgi:ABC-type antimicrobial peptide transport system permease subunit
MAVKILIGVLILIVAIIFGAIGAWVGLTMTAINPTLRDKISMTVLCTNAVNIERKSSSGGTTGYGSNQRNTTVYEFTCHYADGSQEIIPNDKAMLTAFTGGTIIGTIIGIAIAFISAIFILIVITRAK